MTPEQREALTDPQRRELAAIYNAREQLWAPNDQPPSYDAMLQSRARVEAGGNPGAVLIDTRRGWVVIEDNGHVHW